MPTAKFPASMNGAWHHNSKTHLPASKALGTTKNKP